MRVASQAHCIITVFTQAYDGKKLTDLYAYIKYVYKNFLTLIKTLKYPSKNAFEFHLAICGASSEKTLKIKNVYILNL